MSLPRRILVTGASGFLGAVLVRRLLERGDDVRCLVRSGALPDGAKRVEGDVTNREDLARAVEDRELVFHLAGLRRAATREPFMAVNALATKALCEVMVEAGAKRLVLAGSLAASGPSRSGVPRREDEPLEPLEWYGESKAEAERLAFTFSDRLEVVVARPPRILGPGDRENLVFFKLVKRGVLLALSGGPRPLSVVDVEDVADAMVRMGDAPEAIGQAFFTPGPEDASLEQLQAWVAESLSARPRTLKLSPTALTALAAGADVLSRVTGRKLPLNRKLARQLLAPAWTCSGEKAERLLGWKAIRSPRDSVHRSARWYAQEGWI